MKTVKWPVWLAGLVGCIFLIQVNAGDDAGQQSKRAGTSERERNRPAMMEKRQAQHQANLHFWRSVEGRDAGDAIPDVKAHLRSQHEQNLVLIEERYSNIVARAGVAGERPQADGTERRQKIELLAERHAARKTAMEESFTETIAQLDALQEKDDLTWADVRRIAKPGRASQKLRSDRAREKEGARQPDKQAAPEDSRNRRAR